MRMAAMFTATGTLGKLLQVSAHAPGYQDSTFQQTAAPDADHPAELNFTLLPGVTVPSVSRGADVPVVAVRTLSGTISQRRQAGGRRHRPRRGMIVGSDSVPEGEDRLRREVHSEGVPDTTNVLSVLAKGLVPRFPLVDGKGDQSIEIELKPRDDPRASARR